MPDCDVSEQTIIAAIDESYGPEGDHLVLGGYAATHPEWVLFEHEWGLLLQESGVAGFHATDVRGGKGFFAGMPIDRRIKFIEDAEAVANRNLRFRFYVVISMAEYREHYANGLIGVHRESAYGMCFRAAISSILLFAEHAMTRSPDRLDFIVEEGHRNANDLRRVFEEYRGSVRPPARSVLGDLNFGGKDDRRLHAADAMAYAGWRDLEINGSAWAADAPNILDAIDPDDFCPLMRGMVTVETLTEYRGRVLAAKAARVAYGRAGKTAKSR